ncbi:MAG: MBL fold metallo-hydrolase [Gammaproteobacteria bacterium]|nr:MBL fold metallo-hydrolase [Gammaproteobacteria bacterium]
MNTTTSKKQMLLLTSLLVFVTGCSIGGLPVSVGSSCPDCETIICPDRETLSIEYLGSGGYVLRRGQDVVLLGPFISNPGVLTALSLKRIEPKADALERWLPDVSTADAIIVGHAHYDHLLDVGWIAEHRARQAMVYGSRTVAHLLAAVPALEHRVTVIGSEYSAGDSASTAKPWIHIPATRVRFLPIKSEHAPHFAGIKFMTGVLDEDLDRLPRRANGWVEGRTLAFLIEFLHPTDDRALFSLHYQDAASNPPLGYPPPGIRVDATLVCVASHRQVSGYPSVLLERVRPRHVVLGHWENFLAPYTQDPDKLRGVPFSDPWDFIDQVEQYVATRQGSQWVLPAPGSELLLVACP